MNTRGSNFSELDTSKIGIALRAGEAKSGLGFNFHRSRVIDANLANVIGPAGGPKLAYEFDVNGMSYAKSLFEKSWGFSSSPNAAELRALPSGRRLFTLDQMNVRNSAFLAYGNGPAKYPVAGGFDVLPDQRPLSLTRMFKITMRNGASCDLDSFDTDQKYSDFWSNVIALEPPSEIESEALMLSVLPTLVEFVDLAADDILHKFKRLQQSGKIADMLSRVADNIAANPALETISGDEVAAVVDQFTALTDPKVETARQTRRLRDAANEAGYILATEDGPIDGPKGPIPAVAGDLYKRKWIGASIDISLRPFEIIKAENPAFINDGKQSLELLSPHSATTISGDLFEKIDSNEDQIAGVKDRLKLNNFVSYHYHYYGNDLKSLEGEPIEEVLLRCENDESFRSTCAVWIPILSGSVDAGPRMTSYAVVMRPLPGRLPVRLPSLFINEDAALQLSWQSTEVRELAATIPLGPGEERVVTIEQTVSREREESLSLSDEAELGQSFQTEYAQEVEREAKSNTNLTSSGNWNASVEGSGSFFGIIKVGGSAAGGQSWTKTSEEFYRSLSKAGAKATNSMTNKARRDVRASTITKTHERRVDRSEVKLRNPNDGRAMSVMLYRTSNVYRQTPIVREIEFVAVPAVPVIEGLQLRWPRTYSRSQLAQAIDALSLPEIVFRATNSKNYGSLSRYWDEWLRQLQDTLDKEYVTAPGTNPPSALPTQIFEAGMYADGESPKADRSPTDDPTKVASRLAAVIASISKVKAPKDTETNSFVSIVEIGTGALVADCCVGAMDGTEPYSEAMRDREVRARDANITLTLAAAAAQAAQARRLGSGDANEVTAVHRDAKLLALLLELKNAPTPGLWTLSVNGADIGSATITPAAAKAKEIQFTFGSEQSWLRADNADFGQICHSKTFETLTFVV